MKGFLSKEECITRLRSQQKFDSWFLKPTFYVHAKNCNPLFLIKFVT